MINLEDLDHDQRHAATAPRGPVCILAGAGTGKTRTITYRIAHMIDSGFVSPQRVLAVSFTVRAAGEMRTRLAAMGIGGVQARTFHSAALKQLAYFWPQVAGDLPWKVLDQKFPLVGRAARSVGVETSKDNVRDLLSEIEWAKSSLVSPDAYPQAAEKWKRTPPTDSSRMAEVYRRYEQAKTSPDGMLLDFDDLLLHIAGALENSPAIAEQFRQQYRSFVVDEYQDITPLQQRVLEAWLGERDDVTVVGDANQTIYSFNGATPRFLLNFSRTYPNATVVKLQRDYRSTPQITDLANTVISRARGRVAGTRLELQGMRPAGPAPEFDCYDDEPTEAREVAAKVKALVERGVPASQIAVLFRINAQSQVFEQAFDEAGILYQVRGGEGFFRRAEIREAIAALTRASRSSQEMGALDAARKALVPVGLSASEPEGARARERWQSLKALIDLVEEITSINPDLDLAGVVTNLRKREEDKQPPTVEGVTLASLHAAKGLEWDAVFLVGLVDNTIPITHAIKAGDAHIEEERRLFYVGVTRAREHLYCSWSLARQEGGRKSRKRTRFLDGIVPEAETTPGRPPTMRARRCRVCGGGLETPQERTLARHEDCPSSVDQEIFETLRVWRSGVAREKNVPAYVVFTDATLQAIAEILPEDHNELLDVPGVGPAKIQQYGDDVLDTLTQFR